ncbi:hypothetical protein Lser_V15G37379 [Lactuca serriola]
MSTHGKFHGFHVPEISLKNTSLYIYLFNSIEALKPDTFYLNTLMGSSSSSTPPSAPSFYSQSWKYHVFLSFRGEDTRKTFVGHLYTALEQQGIFTYKDDETLRRGESIGPSLMKAIEESRIAIIVFSKNYADSSWCLDELAYIMKCKDSRGQIVIPIFYHVDPSAVRKQKQSYGEAFSKHEIESKRKIKSSRQAFVDDPSGWPQEQKRNHRKASAKLELKNKSKIESWRKALVDASNISGWETKHIASGHESKCIEEIVTTISHILHRITSSVNDDNLVGAEARKRHLISKLHIGFGGKRMIGIWGVGGGGKTTLASSVYGEIYRKFDGCCFLKNIREESSNKDGLERLQEKILSGVLKQKQVEVGRVEEGRRMIKDRLHHRKVLIVLDDVDNLEHLEELVGSRDWFGEGSRIIITTRDEHVLTAHKVDVIHNISLLNSDEAMKLFCKHAPRGYRRIKDYEQFSKDVVAYAGGLPLALRVLGRFLCDKEMNEWRSALARLKEIPDANILEVLKISFDGLTPLEKELFLDIACFFRRSQCYTYEESMMILDACGFHPVIGLKVLVQKALITISSDGKFDMHDLVQELAHYIVRGGHPNNPDKHSRIWKKEDALQICDMDNLDKIEAMDVSCSRSGESQHVIQVAANMKKLRWISMNNVLLDARFVANRLLMPGNFPPRELCCLKLSWLNAKQLWKGYKYLPNLRMINLEFLNNLTKIPDFVGLPNLERFMVSGSPLLEEIHPSFGHLEKLVCVEITNCYKLERLSPITRSKKLETLVLSWCALVFNLSKIQQNLENIAPENMNHIRQYHIGQWFFSECLKKLDLSHCNLGDGDIRYGAVWVLPNLQKLDLRGNRFVRFNFSRLRVPRLKWLDVSFCKDLVQWSWLPSSIFVVDAYHCSSLESLGDISNCKWLWKVILTGNHKLDPLVCDMLLNSMLLGNAKDYFVSINLSGIDIWRGASVCWVNWVMTYNMLLPHEWYNHFSGILMFFKPNEKFDGIPGITIKLGVEKDFQSELSQESNETALETRNPDTYVGYVSFSSLRHTGCLNSTYNFISFSCNEDLYSYGHRFRAALISKDDPMQTTKVQTDSSEFWDHKFDCRTFMVKHDSNSSIKILWEPSYG